MIFPPGARPSATKAAACLVRLLPFASCTAVPGRQPRGVDHIVIVWLKRPGNAEDKAKLVDTSKDLQHALPVIRGMSFGRPLPSERPVVDDTFDLAFTMEFASRGDLDAYRNHPEHIRATKDVLRPLARRVVVYDIERN
jgi:hypothetical protein